ncbi:MAG: hypothetical protein AB1751_04740 [Acidobacteriota bacterium]
MVTLTLLAVAAPVVVSWQLLEIPGLTTPPVELLLVREETAVLEAAPERERFLAEGLAAQILKELEGKRSPGRSLTLEYLAAVRNVPAVLFLRGWLRFPGGEVVEANYVSDQRSNGEALGFSDRLSGEKVVLVRWWGKVDEEILDALATIISGTNAEKQKEALESLKKKAKAGRIPCQRVSVEAAYRVELLPCGATKEDMGEALARLWPYLEDSARQRLGVMVQVAYSAQFSVKGAVEGVLFPYFIFLRPLAVQPFFLGLSESPVPIKQLEPSSYTDMIQWQLPSGEHFRSFWGKKEISPIDFSLSFREMLRRYF